MTRILSATTPTTQPSTSSGDNQYTVKLMDTLASVAKAHSISIQDLRGANPQVTLGDRNFLPVGSRLTIPTAPDASTPSAPVADTPTTTPTQPRETDGSNRRAGSQTDAEIRRRIETGSGSRNPTTGGVSVQDVAAGNHTLNLGDTGPAVEQVQRALGLPQNQRTGTYDQTTKDAVARFQAQHQLNPGSKAGQVGATTLRHLQQEGTGSVSLNDIRNGATMGEGDVGSPVVSVQRMLGQSNPTGVFDANTRTAVERFQQGKNLPSTGQVDASTLQQLQNNRVHVDVPFYSQFDSAHVPAAGNTACFRACKAMAAQAGANANGSVIQVATGENRDGTVNVNADRARQGREYMDSELRAGRPVVVGVSHKANGGYNEGITDHYVLITGRGVDDSGRTYYSFHDPATRQSSVGSDANTANRFYLDEQSGKLTHAGSMGTGYVVDRHFEISQVVRNN